MRYDQKNIGSTCAGVNGLGLVCTNSRCPIDLICRATTSWKVSVEQSGRRNLPKAQKET